MVLYLLTRNKGPCEALVLPMPYSADLRCQPMPTEAASHDDKVAEGPGQRLSRHNPATYLHRWCWHVRVLRTGIATLALLI
jgi:hypothetical protein